MIPCFFEIEKPPLHYNFKWVSATACPTNKKLPTTIAGLSGGSILMIIVLCLVIVYFVGGIVFMKFVRKAEGKDVIPNHEFWADLPGLVKDGVMLIVNKARGRSGESAPLRTK